MRDKQDLEIEQEIAPIYQDHRCFSHYTINQLKTLFFKEDGDFRWVTDGTSIDDYFELDNKDKIVDAEIELVLCKRNVCIFKVPAKINKESGEGYLKDGVFSDIVNTNKYLIESGV